MNTIRKPCSIFVNFGQGLFNWSLLTFSVHLFRESSEIAVYCPELVASMFDR